MYNVSFYDSLNVTAGSERSQSQVTQVRQSTSQSALQAVQQENQLAAVDRSELSYQCYGSFSFDFSGYSQGGSTKISWESSASAEFNADGSYQASFSFGFSIEHGEVSFNEGLDVGEEQITGSDFTFDRNGILQLLEELIERLNAQDRQEIDLGGELDERALELLQQLGLIDEEGKATPLLQALSDYAGLDRFHIGQSVIAPESGTGYGSQLQQLAAQNMSQSGNSGVISGSNVNGDVNIDDRDVYNINVYS